MIFSASPITVSVAIRVRPVPSFAVWLANTLMTVDATSSGAGLRE